MADTDTLREDVRKAVRELDGKAYPGSQTHARWQTVRAELLRLAAQEYAWQRWIKDGMRVEFLPPEQPK